MLNGCNGPASERAFGSSPLLPSLHQSPAVMRDVYIVSAVRTPMGRLGGTLKEQSPVDLGAHAMKHALERGGVDGGALDLYVFGNVLRGGHGQLVPRQSAIQAGIPKSVDGYAIDMVCAS